MVIIPKSITIALKPLDKIADKVTGRFTSTSTWCLCSISWATNSLSSAWKSILLVLACDKTNVPADWFYSSEYFQVQVRWCGGNRRELPETTKSAAFQNPLLLQHPLTEVIKKKFINIPEIKTAHCQDLLKVAKEMSDISARNISITNLFRFPLLNLQSLIVLNTKSCR